MVYKAVIDLYKPVSDSILKDWNRFRFHGTLDSVLTGCKLYYHGGDIWEMFPIVSVWWWYLSRLFTRTAKVHMKTTQTKVVFLCTILRDNSRLETTPPEITLTPAPDAYSSCYFLCYTKVYCVISLPVTYIYIVQRWWHRRHEILHDGRSIHISSGQVFFPYGGGAPRGSPKSESLGILATWPRISRKRWSRWATYQLQPYISSTSAS